MLRKEWTFGVLGANSVLAIMWGISGVVALSNGDSGKATENFAIGGANLLAVVFLVFTLKRCP